MPLTDQTLARFRRRLGGADQLDDGIDVIEGFLEAFEDVCSRFGLP